MALSQSVANAVAAAAETEVEDDILYINELAKVGINNSDIQRLQDAGIFTVSLQLKVIFRPRCNSFCVNHFSNRSCTQIKALQMQPSKVLLAIKGMSDNRLKKIHEAAAKLHDVSSPKPRLFIM